MKTILFNLIFIICSIFAYGQANPVAVTAYTKFGNPIEVLIFAELTAVERAAYNNCIATTYPNAEILDYSTNTYNCHGYAWIMQDGGEPCWINQYKVNGANNLSNFWTSDYYGETTAANAVKIFYYNGDHSAVPSPNISGKYISKWGAGPLVQHSPDYCPYGTERRYYKKFNYLSRNLSCSVWGDEVLVGESANYYIGQNAAAIIPQGSALVYNWDVLDNKNDEPVSDDIISIINNGSNANIVIYRAGLYTITCDVCTNSGESVVSYSCQAIIVN